MEILPVKVPITNEKKILYFARS